MRLQRFMGLVMTSLSIAIFAIAGYTQPSKLDANTQSSQPIAQTEQPAPTTQPQERPADVPYVPTPNEVVIEMLKLANVTGDDILYDLGSGDGRIPITAAQKFGTRGIGVEINPKLVEESRANAEKAGVADRVKFLQQDLFKTDLSDATVVTLFLMSHVNLKLRPKLIGELKPGTRIVSHTFHLGEWKPERVVQVQELNSTRAATLYYWVVPKSIPPNLQ
ncbi:MAG TPA: class I SAM-dependent methyltransferase [Coleofasciculaceae cyanobacterium]